MLMLGPTDDRIAGNAVRSDSRRRLLIADASDMASDMERASCRLAAHIIASHPHLPGRCSIRRDERRLDRLTERAANGPGKIRLRFALERNFQAIMYSLSHAKLPGTGLSDRSLKGRGLARSNAFMYQARYRRIALDCLSLAEASRDGSTRDRMIRLAELWARLADRAETADRAEVLETQAGHAGQQHGAA
jgi:hypothetical protein